MSDDFSNYQTNDTFNNFFNEQLEEISNDFEVELLSYLSEMYLLVKNGSSVSSAANIISKKALIHPKILKKQFFYFINQELHKLLDN